jgi:23S rRNA pseudouridine1911/1915/1917 synthase
MFKPGDIITLTATQDDVEKRLDIFLSEQFPDYSRSLFKNLIDEQAVAINTKVATKAGAKLKTNDTIVLNVPLAPEKEVVSEESLGKFGVKIIHQNKDFAIIEKPAGIVVHPPHKNSPDLSLIDWLTTTFQDIEDVGYADRPGIVHRLDKDTSGLMIIPLTSSSHATFSDMFKNREIHKTYMCIVNGHPDKEGTINFPIGRDMRIRNKMTHRTNGRASETNYKVIEYFEETSLVQAEPITGRTHQIRVHLLGTGHCLLGDALYGKPSKLIKRHALHATKLQFVFKEHSYNFESPLPEDFAKTVDMLRRTTKA